MEVSCGGAQDKHRFFKVLMPGFEHKLKIPPAFKRHIIHDNHEKGIIYSTHGSWYVEIQEEGDNLYIGGGWPDFVHAHELEVGHFLVFCYKGDMIFTVDIFDHSACLKEYTPIAIEKKAADKEANFQDPTTMTPTLHHGRRKRVTTVAPTMRRERRKRRIVQKNGPLRSQAQELVRIQPVLRSLGQNSRLSVKNPHQFERIIQMSYYARGCLDVPKGFCEINGLQSNMEVILRDPKGREWPVNFYPSVKNGYFGKGMRKFWSGNKMKVGDKCIFKLSSKRKKKLLEVIIFKNRGVK